jgi:hypothetical protein
MKALQRFAGAVSDGLACTPGKRPKRFSVSSRPAHRTALSVQRRRLRNETAGMLPALWHIQSLLLSLFLSI